MRRQLWTLDESDLPTLESVIFPQIAGSPFTLFTWNITAYKFGQGMESPLNHFLLTTPTNAAALVELAQ